MNYLSLREQICDIGRCLWETGFVAANDGNISVRLPDGNFLATPTGVSKRLMTPEMLAVINENNEVVEGGSRPSSEIKMHLRCYKERPDVNAVVHAHPPAATAFACAHIPLDGYFLSEAVMTIGSVPLAPFAVPGSDDVPDSIAPFLPYHDAILLANHGALTVGVDLTQAHYRMETLEHFANVALAARQLGGAKELSREDIDACAALSKGYPVRHPGYRKYSN